DPRPGRRGHSAGARPAIRRLRRRLSVAGRRGGSAGPGARAPRAAGRRRGERGRGLGPRRWRPPRGAADAPGRATAAPMTGITIRDRRGFTLVELLIALGLLALIMAAILGVFRLGGQVWTRVGERSSRADDVAAVHDSLRETIAGAYPAVIGLEPG